MDAGAVVVKDLAKREQATVAIDTLLKKIKGNNE